MVNQIIKLKRMVMILEEELKERDSEIISLKKELAKAKKGSQKSSTSKKA